MKPHNTGTRMSYGTQPSLFDAALTEAISRKSDPDTSTDAAEQIRTSQSILRSRMYEAFLHGPKTAEEAAEWCREAYGEHSAASYRKRSGELEKRGLICKGQRVRCSVTGGIAYRLEVV